MKGRKGIPNEVKKMRGTDQPCRMKQSAFNVDRISDIKKITSTKNLKLLPTKRAKDIFKQKANQLIALRVLTELDIEHLAVYANSLDIAFSCMEGMREPAVEKYNKEGFLIGYVPRPEIAMYKQMVEQINRIGAEFGFTPISRQRINQVPEDGKSFSDELKALL
ncbi:MAG: P27 family phage terminase small subunit [Tannerella sp.]|jgi:P27 family predicted phage terminase small subunit|nr:P27 family phage terminase small subunit [Tannerella sp.]